MSDSGLAALDAASRQRALDVTGSFIVRAPAGSGKTELLIQRVLALLATVEAPEEVVAITFTRKAAAEMRQRVLDALTAAGTPESAGTPHQQLTLALARAVAKRDSERQWQLTSNPSRLRVQTIDALAQGLARQLPLALGLGAPPDVTEQADAMYTEAARATLRLLESDQPLAADIARLLEHLDNDVERAIRLLALMLQRRDQWLRHLGGHDRAELEAALQRASEHHMRALCELIPVELTEELIALARYAGSNAGGQLAPCVDLTALPEAAAARLDVWRGLAALLLRNDGAWRKKFDKSTGFPAGNDLPDGERKQARAWQERIRALVGALADRDQLRVALHALRQLPPPHYSDAQWQIVQSIVAVLPRAAAELAVVFAEAGVMDFTEVTQRAVRALGDGQGTDLAAAMDARIRHLLIDEFQDTSITQFELVERLVADWGADDGRTLFIVGDPMQSIYRFREAEVGLFLRAWQRGIGPVALEPLTLARNFRSQQGVVEWVNRTFARVLPAASDIATGAVSFEPAAAVDPPADDPPVIVHALIDTDARQEAQRVVDIVRAIRARSLEATIGLLVRQRSHLSAIGPALRDAGLLATAVELDPLATRPLVGDLIALTRALTHGGDRIAWLAVLRAPWCGLTLADLAALAEGEPRTVPELLDDPLCLARLSVDGQARVDRIAAVLRQAVSLRDRLAIVDRIVQTWLALGGPACISDAQRADAERYFEHLGAHVEEQHGIVDAAALEASLQMLFATPDAGADPRFQVMTIHKAKGLQFDYVIVPGLAGVPRADEPALLVWLERASDDGAELLLAPIHAGGAEKDALVRWVEAQAAERQRHEDERLAYVAATRAQRALHWIGCIRRDDDGALVVSDASLLARLWPALGESFERAASATPALRTRSIASAGPVDQSLQRLPSDWQPPTLPAAIPWVGDDVPTVTSPAIEFSWAGETARRVGTVVHRWLQRIAEDALVGWDAVRIQTIAPQIERALAAGGLSGSELAAARVRVAEALERVLTDERGRWILGPHPQQRAELRLTVADDGNVRRVVLDRTFVTTEGARWIVDYKVGTHEGADVERFLDEEQQRYRLQLETYGAALGGNAMLGLYFPSMQGWRAWQQQPSVASGAPEDA